MYFFLCREEMCVLYLGECVLCVVLFRRIIIFSLKLKIYNIEKYLENIQKKYVKNILSCSIWQFYFVVIFTSSFNLSIMHGIGEIVLFMNNKLRWAKVVQLGRATL